MVVVAFKPNRPTCNRVNCRNKADCPLVQATQSNHTRVSWVGSANPEMIDGLKVSYCCDGMMCIGPIDTPVRYTRVCGGDEGQEQVIDLQLSLAGLRMLSAPRRQAEPTVPSRHSQR